MPTNEERREVAVKLRDMAVRANPSWPALMEALGCPGRAVAVQYLADLIEPEERTCHMRVLENARGNPKYFLMYVCSECHGAVVHDEYDPIYYCPNCGAKVVEE